MCSCNQQSSFFTCGDAGYPAPSCNCAGGGGGMGGGGMGGGGMGGGGMGGGGWYKAPWTGNATPVPIPMNAQQDSGGMGLASVARALAGQVADYAAGMMESRKLCGPWKTDGINDHKLCCTPSVGKAGIKVAVCVKFSRPHDPWAQESTLPLAPGTSPYPTPG